MIVDQLSRIEKYNRLEERIMAGLVLLNEDYVRTAVEGRYEVEGEDLFFIVQEYQTQPFEAGLLEIHQLYLDIQYVVSGRECIGYHPLEGLIQEQPYDSQKDIAFYRKPAATSRVALEAGMFAIFWPHEPHLPCRSIDGPEKVKKIVVKVRME